jgi:hypothetical protein
LLTRTNARVDVGLEIGNSAKLGGKIVVNFDQYKPKPGEDEEVILMTYRQVEGDFESQSVEGNDDECVEATLSKGNQRYSLLLSTSDDDNCTDDSVDWRIIVGVVAGVVFVALVITIGIVVYMRIRSV